MHGDDSLTLLTDLYQLTMAYGYWKTRTMDREAVFHLFFRKNPFGGGYAIAAGLAQAIAWLDAFRFTDDDRAFLARCAATTTRRSSTRSSSRTWADLRLTVDLDAIPEGTAVFAHEPLIRVQGPLLQCQLVETALLNVINFQTLIATKAARVCDAARGDSVLEFGLRRARASTAPSRRAGRPTSAACSSTSNVLAGRRFGIPVRGTHAHSWVMSFGDELEAFKAYASAMPNNCVFLVDTYDTLEGVRRAVQVAQWLKENGHTFIGIRLDSGDLAELSIAARKILDEGGFPEATIVASNDLDEGLIQSLKHQGATISCGASGPSWSRPTTSPRWAGSTSSRRFARATGPGATR
jgi:nicotinate phosphoribosyltransferase